MISIYSFSTSLAQLSCANCSVNSALSTLGPLTQSVEYLPFNSLKKKEVVCYHRVTPLHPILFPRFLPPNQHEINTGAGTLPVLCYYRNSHSRLFSNSAIMLIIIQSGLSTYNTSTYKSTSDNIRYDK